MRELLTDPDAFFAVEADRERFAIPIAIVVAVGLLQIATQYLLLDRAFGNLSGGGGGGVAIALVVGLTVTFAVVVGLWLLGAALFHGISLLFDGEGPFLDTLRLTAWGWFPAALGAALTLAVTVAILPELPVPSTFAETGQFFLQYASHDLVRLATGVSVGLGLWQAMFWTFAVKHARGLTTREAGLTVVVPVAVWLLWQAQSLL